jgi:hypothetical protein
MTTTHLVAYAGTVIALHVTKPEDADVSFTLDTPTKAELAAADPESVKRLGDYVSACAKLKPDRKAIAPKKPVPYRQTSVGFGAKCLRCYRDDPSAGSVYCTRCLNKYAEGAE